MHTIVDHVFVLAFVVVYPAVGFVSFRRLLRRIEQGRAVDRSRLYAQTIVGHWALLAVGLILWTASDRRWEDLGIGVSLHSGFLLAGALTLGAIGFLAAQIRAAAAAGAGLLGELRRRFGVMQHLVPHTRRELRSFYRLSMTAGIVEEILWRGYLIDYLADLVPLAVAATISTVAFGLAHAYQGIHALPRVTIVGAAFTVLYLLSGSVWLPIILHGAVDMLQGRYAYTVIERLRTPGDGETGSDS